MLRLTKDEHNFTTLTCAHCGQTRRVLTSCGNRFCPICSRLNAARVRKRLSYVLKNLHPQKNQSLKMLTLSMPNCPTLSDGIKKLVASFRKLRQSQDWKRHVSGGAMIIEVTGDQGDWHPHFHILMFSSFYPRDLICKAWFRLTKGTAVWISQVNETKAMNYVTKYLTKMDVDTEALYDCNENLKKYRLFQRFGTWHHFKIPKLKSDVRCDYCQSNIWLTEWDIRREESSYSRSG